METIKIEKGIPLEFYAALTVDDVLLDLTGFTARLVARKALDNEATLFIHSEQSTVITFGTFNVNSVDHNIKIFFTEAETEAFASHRFTFGLRVFDGSGTPFSVFDNLQFETQEAVAR
jgi:hypothetical protein